ncbi:glycosyltransferase family 4 protein [Patescibacteria group bacterium]|nr:glycosyltransferase family 4 protein [Patescibacteria group bacterium]
MPSLRVLILTYIYTDNDPRYGGEGRVVWETTQALARAGVRVHIVTSMINLHQTPHPNITVYKVPFAKKHFLNFNPGELLKMFFFCIPLLWMKKIQIIHQLPTNGPNLFIRFKFGRIFAESADPAWDYENPKFGDELQKDRANKMREAGLARNRFDISTRIAQRLLSAVKISGKYPHGTDLFFCRTEQLREELSRTHTESICRFVPNGVDCARFSPTIPPRFPRTRRGIRFLYVGSVSRRKGVHYLVNAFKKVAASAPDAELLIAGGGEPDFVGEMKKLAQPYPQIQFLGRIEDADLPSIYSSADVFCLVPLSGSTPTVLAEALASGLPIIATRGSGAGEAVARHKVGYIVEPGNVDELSNIMRHIITHRDDLPTLRHSARTASSFYSWDALADSLIKGYRDALDARSNRRQNETGR